MIRRLFWPAVLVSCVFGQGQYQDSLLSGLEWRDVGPMRGGRSFAVSGHPAHPDTFYFGSVGGGVWKTENAGRTWLPVSDKRAEFRGHLPRAYRMGDGSLAVLPARQ